MLPFVYTDRLVPAGFDAITVAPLVFARPKFRGADLDARAMRVHELVHLREQLLVQICAALLVALLAGAWWPLLLVLLPLPAPLWWFAYAVPAFRLAAEIRAYAAQAIAGGITVDKAVDRLMGYGTGVTRDRARELLIARIEKEGART